MTPGRRATSKSCAAARERCAAPRVTAPTLRVRSASVSERRHLKYDAAAAHLRQSVARQRREDPPPPATSPSLLRRSEPTTPPSSISDGTMVTSRMPPSPPGERRRRLRDDTARLGVDASPSTSATLRAGAAKWPPGSPTTTSRHRLPRRRIASLLAAALAAGCLDGLRAPRRLRRAALPSFALAPPPSERRTDARVCLRSPTPRRARRGVAAVAPSAARRDGARLQLVRCRAAQGSKITLLHFVHIDADTGAVLAANHPRLRRRRERADRPFAYAVDGSGRRRGKGRRAARSSWRCARLYLAPPRRPRSIPKPPRCSADRSRPAWPASARRPRASSRSSARAPRLLGIRRRPQGSAWWRGSVVVLTHTPLLACAARRPPGVGDAPGVDARSAPATREPVVAERARAHHHIRSEAPAAAARRRRPAAPPPPPPATADTAAAGPPRSDDDDGDDADATEAVGGAVVAAAPARPSARDARARRVGSVRRGGAPLVGGGVAGRPVPAAPRAARCTRRRRGARGVSRVGAARAAATAQLPRLGGERGGQLRARAATAGGGRKHGGVRDALPDCAARAARAALSRPPPERAAAPPRWRRGHRGRAPAFGRGRHRHPLPPLRPRILRGDHLRWRGRAPPRRCAAPRSPCWGGVRLLRRATQRISTRRARAHRLLRSGTRCRRLSRGSTTGARARGASPRASRSRALPRTMGARSPSLPSMRSVRARSAWRGGCCAMTSRGCCSSSARSGRTTPHPPSSSRALYAMASKRREERGSRRHAAARDEPWATRRRRPASRATSARRRRWRPRSRTRNPVDAQRLGCAPRVSSAVCGAHPKRAAPPLSSSGCRARERWCAVRGTYDVSDAMIDAQAHGEPFAGGWAHAAAPRALAVRRAARAGGASYTPRAAIHLVGHCSAAASRRSSPGLRAAHPPRRAQVVCADAGGGGGRRSYVDA